MILFQLPPDLTLSAPTFQLSTHSKLTRPNQNLNLILCWSSWGQTKSHSRTFSPFYDILRLLQQPPACTPSCPANIYSMSNALQCWVPAVKKIWLYQVRPLVATADRRPPHSPQWQWQSCCWSPALSVWSSRRPPALLTAEQALPHGLFQSSHGPGGVEDSSIIYI